jgi:hypothetical protein
MPAPREVHKSGTQALSFVMFVLGVAMLVSTLVHGGGPLAIGTIMGLLFALSGAGRLYISRKGG